MSVALVPDTLRNLNRLNPALEKLVAWCAANYRPPEAQVNCPYCSHQIPEKWQPLMVVTESDGTATQEPYAWINATASNRFLYVYIRWMKCHNDECGQIIIQINRKLTTRRLSSDAVFAAPRPPMSLMSLDGKPSGTVSDPIESSDSWIALPRAIIPFIDPSVPPRYAQDFREAWAIIDYSHRMSTVLARKVLQDLLAQYANLTDYMLDKNVAAFIADTDHPRRIRENMDYLRVLANMGAHTKKDKLGDPLEATKEEAEWTLELISELFEYFIIDPIRDKEKREAINERLKSAGKDGMLPKNPND